MKNEYFNHLNYSLGDEDTTLEVRLLKEGCKQVVSIAGSGGRIIPLLAKRPERLVCVDVSALQLLLTELRVQAIKQLKHTEFLGFLGYPPYCFNAGERKEIFSQLILPEEKKSILFNYFDRFHWQPIIYLGKFEKMLSSFSKIIRFVTNNTLLKIFNSTDLISQREFYYSSSFPKRRWNFLVHILGNATALNYFLYKGSYPKKNIPLPHSQIYQDIFHRIFTQIVARKSFFLQLLLLGRLQYPEGNLIETQEDVFHQAKEHSNHVVIDYINSDIMQVMQCLRSPVEFLSLSDVPSFFTPLLEENFLQDIKHTLAKNAMIVFRNHMRVVQPNLTGYQEVTEHYDDLIQNEVTQLWKPNIVIKE